MECDEGLKVDSQNVTNDGDLSDDEELAYEDYYRRLHLRPPNLSTLGPKIAEFLERLVQENEHCVSQPTVFDIKQAPSCPLRKYVQRIVDYSLNSPESWIVSLVLIERFLENSPGVCVNKYNIHK